ncbi:Putative Excisionase [Mesorhizobium escarrei]|uniref:Excisionase n=1 Tax=Mesorhizobium escarrei TaxID=666018 RepID=A0ABN8K7P1_9HYPH|nr:Putative Excisionase [Mesorhizobium escarrei]
MPEGSALKIPEQFDNATPLRIETAAQIAFPDGSIGAAGLRKERDAGRLETELIAGKEYVTLAAIARMRELCRGRRKGHASSGGTKAEKMTERSETGTDGSSATGQPSSALAAAKKAAQELKMKRRSQPTSPTRTSQRASADAVRMMS